MDMETFKIGITGTRSGMNVDQLESFRERMESFARPLELHHGDCVGVDIEAAEIARELGIQTVCHPPVDEKLRAHHKSDVILEQKTHFARNRSIVDMCDILFVIPFQTSHSSRGGTWYTHDYAVKKNVPVEIFFPMSSIVEQLMKQGR
jgi:hypothetical protein